MRDGDSKRCLRQSEHMKRSWLEVGSHEEVPCVPLRGLTATCMSSGLQLVCRTVWAHPLVESADVSTALNSAESAPTYGLLLYKMVSYP